MLSMSGATSTLIFTSDKIETSRGTRSGSLNRFLNDHRLQKAVLGNLSRGGELSVVLCDTTVRSLFPTWWQVGAKSFSHPIFLHLHQLCQHYQLHLVSVVFQSKWGALPLYGWAWLWQRCRMAILGGVIVMLGCLGHWRVVLWPALMPDEKAVTAVMVYLDKTTTEARNLFQHNQEFYRVLIGLNQFSQRSDLVFSDFRCVSSMCDLQFYVPESNREFVLGPEFLSRAKWASSASLSCSESVRQSFVSCRLGIGK